jgi:hypothetical protein
MKWGGVFMELFDKFWINEFENLDLPDERINKRTISLLCSMSANPGSNIHSICRDKKELKAAYRLMSNDSFDIDEVMEIHSEKTIERCCEEKRVVLIQDTTGVSYNEGCKEGLGRIGGNVVKGEPQSRGLFCHNVLAFSEGGEPLGLFDQQIWARRKVIDKTLKRSIKEKESYRWIKPLNKDKYFEKETRFIVLSDRESDFKINLKTIIEKKMDFVVRARPFRVDFTGIKLKTLLENLKEENTIITPIENRTYENSHHRRPLKKKYNKNDQDTLFRVKYCPVEMDLSSSPSEKKSTSLHLVQVKEIQKKRRMLLLEWILLTSLPIRSMNEALDVIALYKSRWRIEVFHKAQKSGCRIEKSELRNRERLKRFISLQSLVSFAVCRIKYLLTSQTEKPAENYFNSDAIEILKCSSLEKIRKKNITVKDFVFMLANLEGYKHNKLEKPPGVVVLSKAIKSFNQIAYGFSLAIKLKNVGKP